MIIQRIWAFLIGTASVVIGILRILSIAGIPLRDAIVHLASGLLFIAGAWISGGRYVSFFNILLGIFYIAYGSLYLNLAHSIAGLVSCFIGLFFKIRSHDRRKIAE
jgi:hypothetical protein